MRTATVGSLRAVALGLALGVIEVVPSAAVDTPEWERFQIENFSVSSSSVATAESATGTSRKEEAIANGLSYLSLQQSIGGGWGENSQVEFLSTAETLKTLEKLSLEGGPEFLSGLGRLSLLGAVNLDYSARKLALLARQGVDTEPGLSALFEAQDTSSGGFGFGPSYQPDDITTALALCTLTDSSYQTPGANAQFTLIGILYYLVTRQQVDGGWTNLPSSSSTPAATAVVLDCLFPYRNSVLVGFPGGDVAIADVVDQAMSWLAATQEADGSWEGQPLETAAALNALSRYGYEGYDRIGGFLNLLDAQQPGGSWGEIVLWTALALRALAEANLNPPVAVDDLYALTEDTPFAVDSVLGVLSNDFDPDGDTIQAALETTTTEGSLSFNSDGSFSFSPPEDFSGEIQFTYRVNDGIDSSDSASVTLDVQPVNDPPSVAILEPDGINDLADSQFQIAWTDNDVDDNAALAIYYSLDPLCASPVLIAAGLAEDDPIDSYVWDTSALPEGSYWIHIAISDSVNPVQADCSTGPVIVDHTGAATRELSLNILGDGSGLVQSTPPGISCPGLCSAAFPLGTGVTLSTTTQPGTVFDRWLASDCSGNADCVLSLDADTSVAALLIQPADCGYIHDLTLENVSLSTTETFDSCNSIHLGPSVTLEPPADVTLRAPEFISFADGFRTFLSATLRVLSTAGYLFFEEGNPGLPGDGIHVSSGEFFYFNFVTPFPFQGIDDGANVIVFPSPGSVGLGNINVTVSNLDNGACSILFQAGVGWSETVTINGVEGYVTNFTQAHFDQWLAFAQQLRPSCGIQFNDLYLNRLILLGPPFSGEHIDSLDAAVLRRGQHTSP